MYRLLVPLTLLATASSVHIRSASPHYKSAASDSQIRFAIENKYDDTGPPSKPVYAYNTYSHLEDALLGYLDDPDTKLPETEREQAVQKLTHQEHFYPGQPIERFRPKTVEEYTGYKQTERPQIRPVYVEKKVPSYYPESQPKPGLSAYVDGLSLFKKFEKKPSEPYRLHKVQAVKGSPLSIAHYTRDPDHQPHDEFSHPKYTFSYGVHDKDTGDSKSAHETREGGTVTGYYSFRDADGKQRVVHYTADEHQGFRASVQRTDPHEH